ncbi:NAD(P)-linked oxidoreductase [Klebsormidium nitens]|uniref:NAD(P)-linked oxidoreductase n=1 Tax=Klebsormidium nitens TaxID=105231 RepID=A0A1Y1IEF7_KLENI|nr:NAD(P)-linked oxidoreductase [Klebsormidium nitens]|eukprot:GAQ87086.1 NAD(P)-linked oxidoreductase [Klebsormidium nitens]
MAPNNPTIALGKEGLKASKLGFGCMGMSWAYGPPPAEEQSLAVLQKAVDSGITLFNSADFYGKDGHNEKLLGKAFAHQREKVVLAVKFGAILSEHGLQLQADPDFVRASCEASLKRLGTEYIDLYILARTDEKVPIETTVKAMVELKDEGKIKHLGLSEVSAATIRRAHKVHPITAIELEWSLWERSVEAEIIPTCRELGIGIIAYSPLGRGFFSDKPSAIGPGDFRAITPRFNSENLEKNRQLLENVKKIAERKGATTSQLALAWVLSRGDDVVPIPGTTKLANLESNLGALDIKLSPEEIKELEDAVPAHLVHGIRYPEHALKATHEFEKTPELDG